MRAYIYARAKEPVYVQVKDRRLFFTYGDLPGESNMDGLRRLRLEARDYFELNLNQESIDDTVDAVQKNGVDWAYRSGSIFAATRPIGGPDKEDHYDFLCHYQRALKGKLEGWKLKMVDVYPDMVELFYFSGKGGGRSHYQSIELRGKAACVYLIDKSGTDFKHDSGAEKGIKSVATVSHDNGMLLSATKIDGSVVFADVVGEGRYCTSISRSYQWDEEMADSKAFESLATFIWYDSDEFLCWGL